MRSTLSYAMWTGALFGLMALGTGCPSDQDPMADMSTPDVGPTVDMTPDVGPQPDATPDVTPDMPQEDMPPEEVLPGEDVILTSLTTFPPVPVSCDMPNARYRIPFIMDTDKVRPAVYGDRLNGVPLVPGASVKVGALSTSRMRIGALETTECADDTECGDGFKCGTGGLPGAVRQCIRRTGVEFIPGTIRMDYDPAISEDGINKEQVVTFLVENSGSTTGFIPKEVGQLFDEAGEKDLFELAERATDTGCDPLGVKNCEYRRLLEQFVINVASVADASQTKMSVWWFGGDRPIDTIPLTRKGELQDHFDVDLSVAGQLVREMPSPSNSKGTSNLYQAINRVIDQDLGIDKYKDAEKFLFVVTDGANEVFDPDINKDTILARLEEHNIHLFVLHFDPVIDATKRRDLVSYWAGGRVCRGDAACTGAPTCNTDADCGNHETCRKAKVYAENQGDPVTETPGSHCMLDYSDGRLGPVDDFADLTCRTGGNYIYVPGIEEMRSPLRSLPSVIDGQWSIESEISYLDTEQGAEPGYYRLSGVILGVFGNYSVGSKLSAPIVDQANPNFATVENRPVVRVGRKTN